MADHHEARDGSRRNTYRHAIGRPLTEGNTGAMQWGEEYRAKHRSIWRECWRVLREGGLFVLNVKDHIRGGGLVRVTEWHVGCLAEIGFSLIEEHRIPCPGNGFGANGKVRVGYESVLVFRR